MSAAVVVVVAVGLTSTALLVAMMVALIRHLKVLSAALKRYREEVQPMLEQIANDSDRVRRRAEDVPARVPRRGASARLRRSG